MDSRVRQNHCHGFGPKHDPKKTQIFGEDRAPQLEGDHGLISFNEHAPRIFLEKMKAKPWQEANYQSGKPDPTSKD
jgi:hypothetical protein